MAEKGRRKREKELKEGKEEEERIESRHYSITTEKLQVREGFPLGS